MSAAFQYMLVCRDPYLTTNLPRPPRFHLSQENGCISFFFDSALRICKTDIAVLRQLFEVFRLGAGPLPVLSKMDLYAPVGRSFLLSKLLAGVYFLLDGR